MKILYLGNIASIHVVRWVNEMTSRGHDIHVASMHRPGQDHIDPRVTVHRMPVPSPAGYMLNLASLIRIQRSVRPDLFHIHHAGGHGMLGSMSGFRPRIVSVWGGDVFSAPFRSKTLFRTIRSTLVSADRVCSTSHAMARHIKHYFGEIPEPVITPFGVDMDLFRPFPEKKEKDAIVIGTVKILKPDYGIDLLIKAFFETRKHLLRDDPETARRLRLVIAGEGPSKPELRELVNKLGLSELTEFTGRIPHEKVPGVLNRLDIFAALSRCEESFGVAVLEASACGLPVIVSRAGGLPEVVENEKTGLVVSRESVGESAAAMIRLAKDQNLRKQMGNAGTRHVRNHYEWKKSCDIMNSVYESTLADSGKTHFFHALMKPVPWNEE